MGEHELVGWHCWLNGHKFEQILGDSEGQGSLECCSPWGHKVSDNTGKLNKNKKKKRWDELGHWDQHINTTMYNIDN